ARPRQRLRLARAQGAAPCGEAAGRGVPPRARARRALARRRLHARPRPRGALSARRAADRARRARDHVACPPLQGRPARDRRRRDRHAGDARRGDGAPDPPLVLPRALGRAERADADEPAGVTFEGIALGCGNFGGVGSAPAFFGQGIPEDEAMRIMDRAWDAGISWFDTADGYGGGRSETWIGRWIAERGHRPTLTTKVFHPTVGDPADTGLAPDRIRRQLEASLGRLGVERVDLYLAHEPDPGTPLADTVACFERLVEEGLVGAWGLSNYDAAGIREALERGRPALVQNTYSLLDRRDEVDVLPLCADEGIPYVPFGPLAGGWLTGKYRRDAAFPEGSR